MTISRPRLHYPPPWDHGHTVLLCLNPQDEQDGSLTRSSGRSVERAIEKMARCLAWARERQLPVFHILTPRTHDSGAKRLATIAALTPRVDEPIVYKSGLSFFESRELKHSGLLSGRTNLLLMGFSLACDCLAAALDSRRANKRLFVIEDAIASFDVPPYSAAESEGVVFALISQFATVVSSDDLLSL